MSYKISISLICISLFLFILNVYLSLEYINENQVIVYIGENSKTYSSNVGKNEFFVLNGRLESNEINLIIKDSVSAFDYGEKTTLSEVIFFSVAFIFIFWWVVVIVMETTNGIKISESILCFLALSHMLLISFNTYKPALNWNQIEIRESRSSYSLINLIIGTKIQKITLLDQEEFSVYASHQKNGFSVMINTTKNMVIPTEEEQKNKELYGDRDTTVNIPKVIDIHLENNNNILYNCQRKTSSQVERQKVWIGYPETGRYVCVIRESDSSDPKWYAERDKDFCKRKIKEHLKILSNYNWSCELASNVFSSKKQP